MHGKPAALWKAYRYAERELPTLGLRLSPDKCQMVALDRCLEEPDRALALESPPGVKVHTGAIVLGAPVGLDLYVMLSLFIGAVTMSSE